MKNIANPHNIKLVSLDFDGTIMVYDDPAGHFHPEVCALLNRMEKLDIAWCTNSGRDFADQQTVLERSRAHGLVHEPVAMMCSESFVYVRKHGGYQPMEPWNSEIQSELFGFHKHIQAVLEPHLQDFRDRYFSCPIYIGDAYTVFHVPDRDELPVKLFHELTAMLACVPRCMVTRNGGWVAVITETVGKGNILQEYARKHGLRADEILAAGDQYNDVSMLSGRAARHVGCPSNSIPEVMHAVRSAGGYVARGEGPLGTMEAILHFVPGLRS